MSKRTIVTKLDRAVLREIRRCEQLNDEEYNQPGEGAPFSINLDTYLEEMDDWTATRHTGRAAFRRVERLQEKGLAVIRRTGHWDVIVTPAGRKVVR